MTLLPTSHPCLGAAAALILAGPPLDCSAAEWLAPAGGSFATPANWSGGVVPGSTAQLTFGLDAAYVVSYPGPRTSDRLAVTGGMPTLDLGGHIHEITGFGFFGTPLAVTLSGGGLRVANGELKAIQIAAGAEAPGDLEIQSGGIVRAGPGSTLGAGLSIGTRSDGSLTVRSGGKLVASRLRAGVEGSSAIFSQGIIETESASIGSEGNTNSTVWILSALEEEPSWTNSGLLVVGGGLSTAHLTVESSKVTTAELEVGIRPHTVNPPGSGFPNYTNLGIVELRFGGSMEVAGSAHFGGSDGVAIGNARLRTSERGNLTVGGTLHLYPGATISQSALEPGPQFDFGAITRHGAADALFKLGIRGSLRVRGPLDMNDLRALELTDGSTLRVDGPLHLRPGHPLAVFPNPFLPQFPPQLHADELKGEGGLTLSGGSLHLKRLHLGGPEADARPSLAVGNGAAGSFAIAVEENVIIAPGGTLDLRGASLSSAGAIESSGSFHASLATIDAPFHALAGSTLDSETGITFKRDAVIATDLQDSGGGSDRPLVEFQAGLRLGSPSATSQVTMEADVLLSENSRTVIKIGGGPGLHDRLDVTGTFTTGGILEVGFLPGYHHRRGENFQIFTATAQAGAFSEVMLPTLPFGLKWHTADLAKGRISTRGLSFDEWIAALPADDQPPPDQRGPDDQPAGDGVPNFYKYALGVLPSERVPSVSTAFTLLPRRLGGDALALEVVRSRFALAAWRLETSEDLTEWDEVAGTLLILDPDFPGNRERVRITSPLRLGERPGGFLRARVSPE